MIYLIGGAPRIGKSILAKEFAKQVGAEVVSTDGLEMSNNNLPKLGFCGDPEENILPPMERVRLQTAYSEVLEPTIEHLISTAFNEQKKIIIEGIHLLPSHVVKYIQKYSATAVFVGWKDAKVVLNGMAQNNNPNDWLKDSNETVRRQVADFTIAFSEYISTEAEKHDLPYTERTEDFQSDIKRIISTLTK